MGLFDLFPLNTYLLSDWLLGIFKLENIGILVHLGSQHLFDLQLFLIIPLVRPELAPVLLELPLHLVNLGPHGK